MVAIAQARLGSDRLPGKVLLEVGGRAIVDRLLDVLQRTSTLDTIVLAVPDADDALIRHVVQHHPDVLVHAGPEDDVLSRYVGAAASAHADVIVRITGDCPLLDPAVVDHAVATFLASTADYLTVEGHARGLGDVEVCTAAALDLADREAAADSPHREHVMTWLATHGDQVEVVVVQAEGPLHRPDLRACVDTAEDLALVRATWAGLDPGAPPAALEVIRFLDAHPEVRALNAGVVQKPAPER